MFIINLLTKGVLPLLSLLFKLISKLIKRSLRRRHAPQISGTPIMLSYYTQGVEMLPIKQGRIADMRYSAIAFLAQSTDIVNDAHTGLLYRIELPFESDVHLLGIPKDSDAVPLNPKGGVMEEVHLEGNYSKYFALFAEKQMQTQSRYVLDPAGMVFTLDFCRSHSWEIVGNELYFVQTGRNHKDDKTSMEQDIKRFVREIQPSIGRPLSELAKKLQTPYGADTRNNLVCPMCAQLLIVQDDYMACPKQHGLLVKFKNLKKIDINKILPYRVQSGQVTTRPSHIACPHCDSAMTQTGYDGSKTMIDVCPKCPYRWLDAGEYRT
jgi:Zn finger protein HypA/HybF involved in hydrogenase expression